MERGRARRSSASGALNQSAINQRHVLGQLFRTVLSEILYRRSAVVFGEERDQSISVSLSMRLLTQDKKKKKKYLSFPVLRFRGTLTVTHSH